MSVRTAHGFAVSDGDIVKFGRQRVRMFGIDAPEKEQPCDDDNWYPVPLATKALVDFIAGAESCLCNGNPAPVPELRLRGLDNYVSAPVPAQGDGHARPSM